MSGYPQALELKITKVITKDGQEFTPDKAIKKKSKFSLESKWVYFVGLDKKDWSKHLEPKTKKWTTISPNWYTEAKFNCSRAGPVNIKQVKQIEGNLILRFAKGIKTLKINPFEAMAKPITFKDIIFEATAITNTGFDLYFSKGGKNLVSIAEYTAAGKSFGQRSINLSKEGSGYRSSIFNRQGLDYAILTFATSWDERSWPIRLQF